MGGNKSLEISSCIKIVSDLQRQSNYIGFLMKENNIYVGLANCFINYSTFKAKPLLNIHDFVVRTENRGKGVATRFMGQIKQYAVEMGYCRINLEVRTDNEAAKHVITSYSIHYTKLYEYLP